MKVCQNIKELNNTPTNTGGNTLFSCFTFTGKERDEETGYSYFSARYYDPETSCLWLSVDPKADKYPGINPHAYCTWNPVKLFDPDGMELWIVGDNGGTYKYCKSSQGC